MNAILLTVSLVMTHVVVDAETLEGESYHGEVVSWSDATLVIQDGESRHELATDRLQWVRQAETRNPLPRPACWIELRDGSRLAATDVHAKGDSASIQTPRGTATCPLREIHTVRWLTADPKEDDAWQAMMQNSFEGDAAIVRREANSLDFLEGTLHAISDTAVSFEFDGQTIELPRERLAGLVLFRPEEPASQTTRFQAVLADGSRWNGSEIQVEGEELLVRTARGVRVAAPLNELREVAFTPESLVYLSDLPVEQSVVEPVLHPIVTSQRVFNFLYQPRFNEGFGSRPLQLQFPDELVPRTYTKGLALHSRSQLIYRLNEPYRELRGVIGWDPEFRGNGGTVQLQLQGDGEVLWEGVWKPDDPPVEITVPIRDVKRLELLVDYADGSDVGDHLQLCNLRLLK